MQTTSNIADPCNDRGSNGQQNLPVGPLNWIAVPLRAMIAISILALASCGGGDIDDRDSAAPTPSAIAKPAPVMLEPDSNALSFSLISGDDQSLAIANGAPVITDLGVLAVLEGSVDVASLTGTDPDGNALRFSIVSGDDQSLFNITSAGVLSFTTAPDFEMPADADRNNNYLLSVQVTDGFLTDNQSLVVNVTDAFEGRVVDAPIAEASVFIDLNANNEQDADEPGGITDADGYFRFPSFTLPAGGVAKIVSRGGTDTKTGKPLPDLVLISDVPADVTKPANVTPLTTVLFWGKTPEQKAKTLRALRVSGTAEELLTSDGWAEAEAGDEAAKDTQRANQQVGLLLQTATTLADDDDESTDVSLALAESVGKQIFELTQSQDNLDLMSKETIQTIFTEATGEVTPTVVHEVATIAAVANSVAMVNAVVADTALDPVSDTAKQVVGSAQNAMQTSVANVVSGAVTVTDFADETEASTLFANVAVTAEAPDNDSDGLADVVDSDDDNDGVVDTIDAFPLDQFEAADTDADGAGNNADTDDDNDGVVDTIDAFPLDQFETVDTDSDGTGNNADTDDDNDGVADRFDAFSLDQSETTDTDADGVGNNADADDDGDGVADISDAFPLNKFVSVVTPAAAPVVQAAPADTATQAVPADATVQAQAAPADTAAQADTTAPEAPAEATAPTGAAAPTEEAAAQIDAAAQIEAAAPTAEAAALTDTTVPATPADATVRTDTTVLADPAVQTDAGAPAELVAELTVDEALWRPGNRWIVEGNLTKADGTTDVGGFVIAQLVKADGTRIEIGRATVDILPVPGFDIANRPINPASLNNVSEANDHVEVFAISSDGLQEHTVVIFINAPPAPIPHVGTEVVIEAVEIIPGDRLIIHGFASLNDGPAPGVAVISTDQSGQQFEVALDAIGPLAGGFDFVVRPI
ncbi:MAG: cadherin repeat domain-containing protein, partial [Gammaproteobacteria bacterium]|nr:cadherin repeat domain-containing protein [Gammaproteobacteria bacterium]